MKITYILSRTLIILSYRTCKICAFGLTMLKIEIVERAINFLLHYKHFYVVFSHDA